MKLLHQYPMPSVQLAVALVAGYLLCHVGTAAADDLTLVRQSGQIITGDFDHRSNNEYLFLIKRVPQMVMRTQHSWAEFQTITFQGNEVSKEELLQHVPKAIAKAAKRNRKEESFNFGFAPPLDLDRGLAPVPLGQNTPIQHPPTQHERDFLRVASLNINAYIANWDRDAALDGLVVHVLPVNSQSGIVPVDGQIDLKLIGQRHRQLDALGRNNHEQFPELERWSKLIRKADFGPNGAVIKLEFRNTEPEYQTELADGALLTGSLGVPGQGRFEASASDVLIRPLSDFRDEHWLGSRSRSRVHSQEGYPRPYRRPFFGRSY